MSSYDEVRAELDQKVKDSSTEDLISRLQELESRTMDDIEHIELLKTYDELENRRTQMDEYPDLTEKISKMSYEELLTRANEISSRRFSDKEHTELLRLHDEMDRREGK